MRGAGFLLTCAVAAICVAASGGASAPAARTFDVDPATSTATIEVGKSGPLSALAGHTHEVAVTGIRGTVHLSGASSEVELTIPVSAMKVNGAHEPPDDVAKIQQTMMSDEVLDVRKYPTISFRSTSVAIRSQTASALDVTVDGRLTIHGVTEQVSLPVHADLGERTLAAEGHMSVRQRDYGIKPVSVGGVVAVKDELRIAFHISGRSPEARGAVVPR